MSNRHARSAAAFAVVLVVLSVVGVDAADAAVVVTRSSAVQTVGSGRWGAVATTATASPYGTGMLTLTFGISALVPPPPQFFSVGNTGTLTLTAGQYSVSSSANTLIEACSLGWNEGANTCAGGTITTVVSTGASPNASTIVPSVGSHIRLRARITVVLLSLGTTVTVGVSVDRSKVRSATTTNS